MSEKLRGILGKKKKELSNRERRQTLNINIKNILANNRSLTKCISRHEYF